MKRIITKNLLLFSLLWLQGDLAVGTPIVGANVPGAPHTPLVKRLDADVSNPGPDVHMPDAVGIGSILRVQHDSAPPPTEVNPPYSNPGFTPPGLAVSAPQMVPGSSGRRGVTLAYNTNFMPDTFHCQVIASVTNGFIEYYPSPRPPPPPATVAVPGQVSGQRGFDRVLMIQGWNKAKAGFAAGSDPTVGRIFWAREGLSDNTRAIGDVVMDELPPRAIYGEQAVKIERSSSAINEVAAFNALYGTEESQEIYGMVRENPRIFGLNTEIVHMELREQGILWRIGPISR
ncbi:hypothetical protein ABW19_dt0201516 [Dactylella cylindrospora]|nr:hypothetical protein ABW19_dt0201516 [Dactylella cylindrospora]